MNSQQTSSSRPLRRRGVLRRVREQGPAAEGSRIYQRGSAGSKSQPAVSGLNGEPHHPDPVALGYARKTAALAASLGIGKSDWPKLQFEEWNLFTLGATCQADEYVKGKVVGGGDRGGRGGGVAFRGTGLKGLKGLKGVGGGSSQTSLSQNGQPQIWLISCCDCQARKDSNSEKGPMQEETAQTRRRSQVSLPAALIGSPE